MISARSFSSSEPATPVSFLKDFSCKRRKIDFLAINLFFLDAEVEVEPSETDVEGGRIGWGTDKVLGDERFSDLLETLGKECRLLRIVFDYQLVKIIDVWIIINEFLIYILKFLKHFFYSVKCQFAIAILWIHK